MKKLIYLFVLAILISGCATNFTQFPQRRQQLTSKTYNTTYEKAISATIKAFESDRYPIKQIDKENGIIETGELSTSFGIIFAQKKAYAHLIKISETSIEIKLNIYWEGDERWLWKDYQRIFNAIDKELGAQK